MEFGVNTYGLGPYLHKDGDEVWKGLLAAGVSSLEPIVYVHIQRGHPETAEEAAARERGLLDGIFPLDTAAEQIRRLREMGFEIFSFHPQIDPISVEAVERLLPFMKETGLHYCVNSFMESSVSRIREKKELIRQICKLLRDNGMEFLAHNHDMEWTPDEGSSVMQWLLENIPELQFELDVGWTEYAGRSSVEIMKQYSDRFPLIHIKEIASDAKTRRNQALCVAPGRGILPLREILETAKSMPLEDRALIIDQDDSVSGDIVADISEGVETLRRLMRE